MAPDKKESDGKKKMSSKWRKRGNLTGTGSREKGQGFAQARRTKAIREYQKLVKKTKKDHQFSSYVQNIYDSELKLEERDQERVPFSGNETTISEGQKERKNVHTSSGNTNTDEHISESTESTRPKPNISRKRQNKTRFTGAQDEYKRKKFDKAQNQKEREAAKEKRIEELQKSLVKRRATFQKLTKRTRRGQPVMANQINHLLTKIKS